MTLGLEDVCLGQAEDSHHINIAEDQLRSDLEARISSILLGK